MGLAGKVEAALVVVALVAMASCGGRASRQQQPSEGDVGDCATRACLAGEGGQASRNEATAGDEVAGEPSLLEQLPSRYLDDLCLYYAQCQHVRFRDLEHCRAELDPYGVDTLKKALEAGSIALDQDRLRQCLDDFDEDPCNPPRAVVTLPNDPLDIYQFLLACPGVLQGQRQEDEPCLADAECGPRMRCEASSCPGVCKPYYELGTPCAMEHWQCAIPHGICLQGTCRVPLEAGGPCADDLDCIRDLVCDPDTQVCVEPAERPGLGGACIRDFNGGKPAIQCQPGLYCDDDDHLGSLGVCKPLSGEDEPCDYQGCQPDLECVALGGGPLVCHGAAPEGGLCDYTATSCQEGLFCLANGDPAPSGVCQVGPTLGEACSFSCAPGYSCQEGRCVSSAYLGDPCGSSDTVCESSRCVDGICREHLHVGDPCQNFEDCLTLRCQKGFCVDGSACTP